MATSLLARPLRVRCHYCSRFRSPGEIIRIGTGGAVMCWHCWESHLDALRILSGKPPKACGGCGVSFDVLQDAAPGGDIKMYVHPKDGIYQLLCRTCSDRYVRQRADLYGSTEFGWREKLK